ncbi:MAG: efflux RND transporter periplasmic adaptor subunit [Fusobacteriaceae bacterium]
MKKQIIGLTLLAILVGCGKEKEVTPTDLAIRPVAYIQVEDTKAQMTREFSGTIIPEVISKLSFRVSGTLIERNVSLGSQVKKGEVLAILDSSDYEIKSEEAQANYQMVESDVLNRATIFNRDKKLFLENSVSKAQYDQSKANYMAGKSQLKAAAQNVDYVNSQLEYTKLISPGNGTVAQVDVQLNETVNAGTTILTLSESGKMQVLFNVSDTVINKLSNGQEVEIKIINSDLVLKGKVSNIGAVSNAYGNTYPVKAQVLDSNAQLKPGMTASVKINFENIDAGKIYLPANAVQLDSTGKYYVMVIKKIEGAIGTVERKIVEIGELTNGGLEIKTGIVPGDYIVTSGSSVLSEGQSVKLGVGEAK